MADAMDAELGKDKDSLAVASPDAALLSAKKSPDHVVSDLLWANKIVVSPTSSFETWFGALAPALRAQLAASYTTYLVTKRVWTTIVAGISGSSSVAVAAREPGERGRDAVEDDRPWKKSRVQSTVKVRIQVVKAYVEWRRKKLASLGPCLLVCN